MSRTLAATRTVAQTRTTTSSRDIVNQNLIYNGNFELTPPFVAATAAANRWIDGTAAGSNARKSYGWADILNTGTCSVSFDGESPHSGTSSLKLSLTATGSRKDAQNVISAGTLANLQRTAPIISPNTNYTFTFWMRTNRSSGDSSNGAFVRLTEYNGAGTAGTQTSSTAVKTTTAWTQYTLTFTTGSTARFLVVQLLNIGNTGTATLIMDAWFDDMILRPTIAPTRTLV
jgi:hypothetical protein